jgi:capsular polysaccharide biosynthesis protein
VAAIFAVILTAGKRHPVVALVVLAGCIALACFVPTQKSMYVVRVPLALSTIAPPEIDRPCDAARLDSVAHSVVEPIAGTSPAPAPSSALSAGVEGTTLRVIDDSAAGSAAAAPAVAAALVERCTALTADALRAAARSLGAQLDVANAAAASSKVPAQRLALAAHAQKLDDLVAQLGDQNAADQHAAAVAAAQLVAVQPAAVADLEALDPAYVAAKAQLDKDTAALDDALAKYTSHYLGLPELQIRVSADQAALTRREQEIATPSGSPSLTLSATYRTALATAAAAEAVAAASAARLASVRQQAAAAHKATNAIRATVDEAQNDQRARSAASADATSLAARLAAVNSSLVRYAPPSGVPAAPPIDILAPQSAPALVDATRALVLRILFIVIGVVVALGIIVVYDWIDRRLVRASEVTALYGKPVISAVAKQS